MAAATYIITKQKRAQVLTTGGAGVTGSYQLNFTASTFSCAVIISGTTPAVMATSGFGANTTSLFLSEVTAVNAEVTGTGYARQPLTSTTVAFDGSVNTYVDFSFANFTFSQNASGFTNGAYLVFFDNSTSGSDTGRVVFAISDPNQTLNAQNGSIILSSPTGGLIQWQ